MNESNPQIKRRLQDIFDKNLITPIHMYQPARNSIKVVFARENEIDKVFANEDIFKENNFEPRMSLALKACRTVFCTNFDPTLLTIYSKEKIIDLLTQQKWKIKDIYIMRSQKSFKIEMKTRKEAQKFLTQESINIGGIRISEESKEPEIDPTIQQCWECGAQNPTHNSQTCPGRKVCIKCGSTDHNFFACFIPKKSTELTESDKLARYCAACGKHTDHTSLDHRSCPKKKEELREKARIAREKRLHAKEGDKRDMELIKRTIDISNTREWPEIQTNQHSTIAMVVTLALLDEASTSGVFNRKLEEACNDNGLPVIRYNLEPETAKHFQNIMCGAHVAQAEKQTNSGTSTPNNTTKYFRDLTRSKKTNTHQESEIIDNQLDGLMTGEKGKKTMCGAYVVQTGAKGKTKQTHTTKTKTKPKVDIQPTPTVHNQQRKNLLVKTPQDNRSEYRLINQQEQLPEYRRFEDILTNQQKEVTLEINDTIESTPEIMRATQQSPSTDDLLKWNIDNLWDTTLDSSETEDKNSYLGYSQAIENQVEDLPAIIYDSDRETIIHVDISIEDQRQLMNESVAIMKQGNIETARTLLLQSGIKLIII